MNAMNAKKPNENVWSTQPELARDLYPSCPTYPEVCYDADVFKVLESLFVEERSWRLGRETSLEEEERQHSAEEGEQCHDATRPCESNCPIINRCRVECGVRSHSLFPGRSASINGQMTAPSEEPVLMSPLSGSGGSAVDEAVRSRGKDQW